MIQRKLYADLKKHLPKKEISIITGPRQAGKTTLMELLRDELAKEGEQTLYLNLDVEWDRIHFTSQAALLKKLELELGKKRGFVFIDEIQQRDNAGLFLKGLFDLKLPYKFIVSGSGSLELKEKIHESLIGRKRLFGLTTVSFEEFVNYRTGYRYADNLLNFFEVENKRAQQFLIEYISFGGYPRVVTETERDEKIKVIDEIYRSIIEKDIAYLLHVEKTDAFHSLIRVLSSQIGNIVNYAELSATLNISFQTLKKYLWYAQKIFLLDTVSPYARNTRKEITRSPVIYFHDLGLRNYSLGIFGYQTTPAEMGFLFQNFAYQILKDRTRLSPQTLHFWRTKDKAEVDFVIEEGTKLIPIEIKFTSLRREEIPRSLRSFIEKYSPSEAYVINLNFTKETKIANTHVYFMPYYQLLSKDFLKRSF